ncbi:MAG: AraC family transcriptional regulator [Dyella sp.]
MNDALIEAVARYTERQPGNSPYFTAIEPLILLRSEFEKQPLCLVFKPALCVVLQGSKWSRFGDRRIDYAPGQALVVSVDTPALSRVVEATPKKPFLGMVLEFDLALLREVMEQMDSPPPPRHSIGPGVFLTDFHGPLADCLLRLVRLLEKPQAIGLLAPLTMREIYYWLLSGPHGGEVARMVLSNDHRQRLIQAVHVLREQFAQSLRIEALAAIAQMSPSTFHRQFKALTAMSPLQYQKQMRLLQARHLLASGAANAESAAFEVGYESPSQFSREYSRMFGAPPRRDTVVLRRGERPASPAR